MTDCQIIESFLLLNGIIKFGWEHTEEEYIVIKILNLQFTIYNELNGLANNLISSISVGKNRLVVSTSGGGLSVFNGKNFWNISEKNGLSNDIVISSCEDKNGNIWVGTYSGGISCIMNNSFASYNEISGLPVNVVKSIVDNK